MMVVHSYVLIKVSTDSYLSWTMKPLYIVPQPLSVFHTWNKKYWLLIKSFHRIITSRSLLHRPSPWYILNLHCIVNQLKNNEIIRKCWIDTTFCFKIAVCADWRCMNKFVRMRQSNKNTDAKNKGWKGVSSSGRSGVARLTVSHYISKPKPIRVKVVN